LVLEFFSDKHWRLSVRLYQEQLESLDHLFALRAAATSFELPRLIFSILFVHHFETVIPFFL